MFGFHSMIRHISCRSFFRSSIRHFTSTLSSTDSLPTPLTTPDSSRSSFPLSSCFVGGGNAISGCCTSLVHDVACLDPCPQNWLCCGNPIPPAAPARSSPTVLPQYDERGELLVFLDATVDELWFAGGIDDDDFFTLSVNFPPLPASSAWRRCGMTKSGEGSVQIYPITVRLVQFRRVQ
ncbi:hypothetical protein BLNAU_12321 [Blattamonas nauphoetae]|uniref:Uncharacterized protein n=1 Tax=Blattamonas nauphoetae TaxID=2049346 RepID=A0ABQ9XJR3_9EUKA|nr:hypothetical protein BLNAU_12321 [Blattamonas nauphoetae]